MAQMSYLVRAGAAAVFAFESAALIDSLRAEITHTDCHILTISAFCWRHKWVSLAVLAGLAIHLFMPPKSFYEERWQTNS